MAIDKSNTPTWVKVTLIVLIVAFVSSFVVIAANPFGSGTTATTNTQTGANSLSALDQQYQPQVAALTSQLQSQPESYTVLVALGNTYFDWAAGKQQASQTSTAAAGADQPLWIAAKDAYSRALVIRKDESPVRVDYAIAMFYSGDTTGAIAEAEGVIKDDPKFGPAPFNVAIFYRALGQNDKSLAAFQRYLEVDPEGKTGGDPAFAKAQIEELRKLVGSQTTTP